MKHGAINRCKRLDLTIHNKMERLLIGDFRCGNFILYCSDEIEQSLSHSDKEKLLNEIEKKFKARDVITFCQVLNKFISEGKLRKPKIYKAASIEKSYFYQILKGTHTPSRDTAIRICLAMKLNLSDSYKLLMPLGYTFYEYSNRDVVIIECINYKAGLYLTEEYLEKYKLPLLCSKSISLI